MITIFALAVVTILVRCEVSKDVETIYDVYNGGAAGFQTNTAKNG